MQVAIDLAESHHGVFTNLDYVHGRVILKMPSTAPITNITVKLEGESQTMITPPQEELRDRKPRPIHEFHKILYDTQVVFPEKELPGSSHYTLPPGQYEYPFKFKIPFNTTCHNMAQKSLPSFPQYIKHPPPIVATHIKAALPPTLSGFPGLASIRYYVKATVNRKEFYKENPRQIHHITFVPIEPPRPAPSSTENYGRRTYQFPAAAAQGSAAAAASTAAADKAPSLRKVFSGLKLNRSNTAATASSASQDTPRIEVDARMPDPAIVTPLQRIPLRVLIKRLDAGTEPVYLQTLQVELVGHTQIRAGQWSRTEPSQWIIASQSNMNELLTFSTSAPQSQPHPPSAAAQAKAAEANASSDSTTPAEKSTLTKPRQTTLNAQHWASPLPATVAPSFKTCNISRTYDVDVRVGIGFGAAPQQAARNQIILPLRLRCAVYSGIAPPPPLLAAMSSAEPHAADAPADKPVSKKPLSAQARENAALAAKMNASSPASASIPAPAADAGASASPLYSDGGAGSSTAAAGTAPPGLVMQDDDPPPPSYEDAMAVQLAPVDGPRTYRPAPAASADDGFPVDAKRRGS